MNKNWLFSIIAVSFVFLALQRTYELKALATYYVPDRPLKLSAFTEARKYVSKEDLDLLKLWESILTGRSAPLSKWMRERYANLGLNHLFTPSGFHLSAVLLPFMKFVKSSFHQLLLLLFIGVGLLFLPGMGALKRMVLIKTNQKLWGIKIGFIAALIVDILFGSFQKSFLSFAYSFLFLGIIYSEAESLFLILFFFFGQCLIAYFQGNDISLLILFFSPVLNLSFGLIMPLLFLLSFPLWEWQVHAGIFLLKIVQALVDICASITSYFPSMEMNIVTLLLFALILKKQWRWAMFIVCLFSASLNLDLARIPTMPKYEFAPRGKVSGRKYSEKYVLVKFSDGSCRMKLVRGYWWETCSPLKRGSKR